MPSLFFTGFPGFLGSALLPSALRRHDRSVRALCLVQAQFVEQARLRAQAIVADAPDLEGRIEIRSGDIAASDLGLADAAGISADIVEIYHLAAVYDLTVARELAMRVNVEGTRHVLDLAQRCPELRRLHYVSTCYVSGRFPGAFTEEDLETGAPFNNYYEETKHLAEALVRQRMNDGLPATIYRPSIVVGDSRSGETQKYDGPYYIIQLLLRQSHFAAIPVPLRSKLTRVNVAPRDYVINAIAYLSGLEHSVGRTYALADPKAPTVREMLDILAAATGKEILRLPVPGKLARLALEKSEAIEDLMRIPPQAIDYFTHPTYYTCNNTLRDLAGSGIQCPPFREYAPRLVQYMREHPEHPGHGMA